MTLNFSKRVITSVILLGISSLCIFTHKVLFLLMLSVTSVISFYEFNNLIKKIYQNKKKDINLLNLIILIFLIFFIYSGYYLYNSYFLYLIFVILICIFSDTGGYIFGKLIGGKKLTTISPNKTVSGCIGSFIFSLIPLILFILFLNIQIISLNSLGLIILSLFLSLVCQIGDLLISYFKRLAKVKDTGSILPGHGGVLDRIDGLIFVLPSSFIINAILN